MTSLIGVHGVFNYRGGKDPVVAASELVQIWRTQLGKGPLGIAAEAAKWSVAYYAHLLREPGGQSGRTNLDELDPEVELMVRAWLDQWDADSGVAQGLGTMPLRQAIGILAEHLCQPQGALESFAAVFFPEVDRYLRGNTPHRSAVRAEVARIIAGAPHPRIVLAHSLGSVVVYEALAAYPHIEVDLLLTLGSPLAMPVVVLDRLDPPPEAGNSPGVRRWVNVADKGDLIAIPRRGMRKFPDVDEDIEAIVHWADFHTAGNYLKTEALAQLLLPHVLP